MAEKGVMVKKNVRLEAPEGKYPMSGGQGASEYKAVWPEGRCITQ